MGTETIGSSTLNIPIFVLCIEAGAVAADARDVPVAEDDGLGVVLSEGAQQGVQGGFLLRGAGVLGLAVLV